MQRRVVLAGLGGLLAAPLGAGLSRADDTSYANQASWGGLCATGTQQSPVDLKDVVSHGDPKRMLPFVLPTSIKGTIKNTGHDIQVELRDTSPFVPPPPNGTAPVSYDLLQMHFHAPSEHRIAGVGAQMEVHFVHQNAASKALAVVGVLLNGGASKDPANALWAIADNAPAHGGADVPLPATDLSTLLPPHRKRQYFQYAGSLTTPPCSETVSWFVMQSPVVVPGGAVAKMLALYNDNARSPQPINRRFILSM